MEKTLSGMELQSDIYNDIAKRTDGDIYVGVVGPVRTGKSTLIKLFMETLVLPNIESDFRRERANDELPQSAAGKTIMTTEPKFIPEEAVNIKLSNSASFNVRMIDCVGYILPSALGYLENNAARMVHTPWSAEPMPFNEAAEIGTRKVINEHSTVGLVVTTDGSISDLPRAEYEEAEQRVIDELKEIRKPFVVLLNCVYPESIPAVELAKSLEEKYQVPVLPVNCLEIHERDIKDILRQLLYEFPIKEISVEMPRWIVALEKDHWLKASLYGAIQQAALKVERIRQVEQEMGQLGQFENIDEAQIRSIDLGKGQATVQIQVPGELFYKVLGETTGLEIQDESGLMPCLVELSQIKQEYDKIKGALDQVAATGYGIVMPSLEELQLDEPEIIKQGGRYGVRLKASAPSIHMMRADIKTEVAPIVGSEKQSEELVMYLLKEFEEKPQNIWSSNIFGKSLHELVNEGLHNKLYQMPQEARMKLQETVERIINEGCSGLICIIL